MKNILNWKSYNESLEITDSGLTIQQSNELEDYMFTYNGFDKTDLSDEEVEQLKAKFHPKSQSFADFLVDIDDEFDWFDYSMTPNIIDFIHDLISDYYETPNVQHTRYQQEEEFQIGDYVDFGSWGKVYVLSFLEDGILVTKNKEDRYLGEEGDGFIIPDNKIDKHEVIEKGNPLWKQNDYEDDDDEDEDDDWWRK